MHNGTILQRKKTSVRISKEETLLILRSYREHRTRWTDVVEDVRNNAEQLPASARELYRSASPKQLRERMSAKLSKLMASRCDIEDADIRQEVELVRDQERRFVQAQPVPAPIQQDLPQPDPPIQREENQVDVAPPPVDDAAEEARARQAPRHDRRDHTAANLSSSDNDEYQPDEGDVWRI
ncbi:hypothetical protein ACF0H5_003325 [Mactra antiquata]